MDYEEILCTDHTGKTAEWRSFLLLVVWGDSGFLLGFRILETRTQVITLLFFGSEDIERRQVASFLVEVQSVAKYEFGGNGFANVFRCGIGELQRIGFEEEGGEFYRTSTFVFELLDEAMHGESSVHNVFDDNDIAVFDWRLQRNEHVHFARGGCSFVRFEANEGDFSG